MSGTLKQLFKVALMEAFDEVWDDVFEAEDKPVVDGTITITDNSELEVYREQT